MSLKFSFRSMLIFVALCGVMLSFATWLRNAELQRQRIVAERTKFHCWRFEPYEKEAKNSYLRPLGAWLAGTGDALKLKSVRFKDLASLDNVHEVATLFPEIQSVTMSYSLALPNAIESLRRLKALRKLEIQDGRVSLEAMYAMSRLSSKVDIDFDPVHVDDTFLQDAATSGMPLHFANSLTNDITDDGLKFIPKLPRLVGLILLKGNVSDDGIYHLRNHPALTAVVLNHSRVTDAGMEHLSTIPNLGQLFLNGCNVTDKGLVAIGQMRNLRQLELNKSSVTGQGLKLLQQLPNLTDISLDDTEISDEDMDALVGIPYLESISLANTQVTDEGMKKLATIRSRLKSLNLTGTKVTQGGQGLLKRFQAK